MSEIGTLPEITSANCMTREDHLEGTVKLLWTRRPLLRRFAGWGLLLSVALAFALPKRYTATARIMPSDAQGASSLAFLTGAVSGSPMIGALANDVLGGKSSGGMFIGILKSRTEADRLVDDFPLQDVYGIRFLHHRVPKYSARRVLLGRTDISDDRKSGIITISVVDGSPERAAKLADAYVQVLNRLVVELSTSSARRERVFLENRLIEARQELEGASKQFSIFATRNSAVDVPAQGKAMVEAVGRLEGELIAVASEQQGLQQVYSPENVRVKVANARVLELRRRLGGLVGAGGDGENAGLAPSMPSIGKLPALGVEYAALYRNVKIQEAVYEALTKQYELAKVQEAKEIPSVKVLDVPEVPQEKSSPKRSLIILLGMLLSIGVGAAWIVGIEHWRRWDPEDERKLVVEEMLARARQCARIGRRRQDGFRSQ